MSELNLIIVPDEDESEAAEIYVDGAIGGHPYRFLLDTGAAKTSVIADDYTSSFDSGGKNDSSGVFAPISEDLIIVPSIEVGPISKTDFMLVRAADNHPALRNLIGMDLLKDYRCHFFFDENRVAVDANDEAEAGYDFRELFLDQRFHPYVDVQFGTITAKAVWDTGASITVVDINFIRQRPTFFREAGQSEGTDSTGTRTETPMYVMAAATIGGHVFSPHRVAGVDLSHVNSTIEMPMNLILGYSTLSQANWLFDFPGRKWAISKQLKV